MSEDSLTILKFRIGTDYSFHVMDKFDEPDEVKRLDKMIAYSEELADIFDDEYEQLWIKTCPVFPTRG